MTSLWAVATHCWRSAWVCVCGTLLVAAGVLSGCESVEGTEDAPAYADWDGRHYELGRASNPQSVSGGYVVDWERYELPTFDGDGVSRTSDAYATNPVEPWEYIVGYTDPFPPSETEDQRELVVTDAARVYGVVEEELQCLPDDDPGPAWEAIDLEHWIEDPASSVVLLTFDANGRVVQIRPIATCG